MTITAARLGHSPITVDWSNLLSKGGTPDKAAFQKAWDQLKARFAAGEVGFYDCPVNPALTQETESQSLAADILGRGVFKDCLYLGIGGSSLGPISAFMALREKVSDQIRFHFMENPDPIDWKLTIEKLDPATTLVVCVTKSGTTFETLAQFQLALEWLGPSRWKSHVVAITDPQKGDLKAFAQAHGIPTLHIAPSLGGRFSVFTPVGVFPLALAGLSVKDFLKGAREVREYVEKQPIEKNPLFLLGRDLIEQFSKRPMHVCMPYTTQLRQLGCWFVQLWAESLGKDGKGFTPLAALGATDQHSILQLLRDGPDDKVTFFVTVDRVSDPVKIPRALPAVDTTKYPAFSILQGHTLHDLLAIEYRAISLVLTRRGRPHLTWQLDNLDERALGALYFAWSTLTAVTGTLWGVNPFDQPGVEEGKVYIRDSLNEKRGHARAEEDDNTPVARLRRERDQDRN